MPSFTELLDDLEDKIEESLDKIGEEIQNRVQKANRALYVNGEYRRILKSIIKNGGVMTPMQMDAVSRWIDEEDGE